MFTRLSLEDSPTPVATAASSFVEDELLGFDALPDAAPGELDEGKQKLRAAGYYGLRIPAEHGGGGAGLGTYLQVLAELYRAHHLLLPELITANGIGSLPLVLSGTEEQRKRLLPDIASGRLITAFALTEPGAGSDTGALATAAVADGDDYLLSGEKHYIGNGATADLLTVIATVDGAPTAFLVPGGSPGLTVVEDQPNLGGFEIAHLRLDRVRVPASAILGAVGTGLRTAMQTLDEGRLHVAAMSIGIADRALQVAAGYTTGRVQFGQPIARFDPVRFMVAESYADLALVVAHTRQAAADLAAGRGSRLQPAVAKYAASEMCVRVVDRCLQAMGAAGYLKRYPMERLYRAARVQKIYDGTSEIMRLIIEKEARASWA